MSDPAPLRQALLEALPDRPFTVEFWDGTRLEPTAPDGPTFTVASPRAIAHALRAPGQLGIGRAYVAGDLLVDDLDQVMGVLGDWKPPTIETRQKLGLAAAAVRSMGAVRPPSPPQAELRPQGKPHTKVRDQRAITHHYDVGNRFFALFLDETMTYSCAIFSRGATSLEEAQVAKHRLVASKLALEPGQRVLDVGCGWGAFAIHAAREHDVSVVGITISPAQAQLARERIAAAGLADSIEIRVMDYRDLPASERFDAIASVGMVEHVGERQIDVYAQQLARLVKPGGQLLNHGIARLRHTDPDAGPFSERYVFPDAEPLHLSRISLALERAGFEVEHAETFREDYAETLSHWVARLDANLPEAIAIAGEDRVRVWRLYLRAARNGFRSGFTGIYQVRAKLS